MEILWHPEFVRGGGDDERARFFATFFCVPRRSGGLAGEKELFPTKTKRKKKRKTYGLLLDTSGNNLAVSRVNGDGARAEDKAVGNDALG